MYKLIHCIFGYYIVSVSGPDAVKMLNMLTQRRLLYWNAVRTDDRLLFRCSLFTMELIYLAAADEGIDLTVEKAVGLPFVAYKYRSRLGLIVGTLAGLVLIFASSLVVWEIQITGNRDIDTEVIMKKLEENSLSVGTFIPSLDVKKTETAFLLSFDGISSISVNIKGTYACVDVIERKSPPETVDTDTDGIFNVVASEDGIITSVEAIRGIPVVSAGDTVLAGEVVISAFSTGIYETVRACHAKGDVYALVNRSFVTEIPFEYTYQALTSNTQTKTDISVLGARFALYSDEKPEFEEYDVGIVEENVRLFGFIKLPLKVTRAVFTEYENRSRLLSEQEAEGLALLDLHNWCSSLDGTLYGIEYEGYADEERGVYVLTADATVEKNIASEKEVVLFGGDGAVEP